MWWYVTRASGIVAMVLFGVSMGFGMLFSGRATGNRPKPNWWLDMHNMLGGLTFGATVLHVFAVVVDPNAGFTLAQALIPGRATDLTRAMAYGTISLYLLAAVVATSWPRLRFRRRIWRAVHLLSIPAALLAVLHGWQSGSDRDTTAYKAMLVVLLGLFVYPAVLRVISVVQKRADRRARRARTGAALVRSVR